MGVSKNRGGFTPPNHPFVHRVFHYKPSILGYHYFWKHPYNIINVDGIFRCIQSILWKLHTLTTDHSHPRNVRLFWRHHQESEVLQLFIFKECKEIMATKRLSIKVDGVNQPTQTMHSGQFIINPYPNLSPFWVGFPYFSPPFGVTSAVWSL